MVSMDVYDMVGQPSASLRDRLVFLLRGGMVKRFHNAATLQEQNIAAHSWSVAWFCYLLSFREPSANLLLAAMAHDMGEQFTGDNPAPAKRAMGLSEAFKSQEGVVLSSFEFEFEDRLSAEERRVLKVSDVFDGMLFCVRERMFGNKFVETTFNKFSGYAREYTKSTEDYDTLRALECMWEEAGGQ
jgi:5'-deoxynucleotidase YfbR-like HD superfamily hydrolase